jgi:glycosyltransferase involved in cell wall biosynthesis
MSSLNQPWICCQLGSREHYAIPRVLHQEGVLSLLLTDFWSRRPALLRASRVTGLRKLAERRHNDLPDASVHDIGFSRLWFDVKARRLGWGSWETTMRRNEWFQEELLRWLQRNPARWRHQRPGVFFAYSYAARHLLRYFRDLGWTTVLGQIDPGIEEENLVAEEVEKHPELSTQWKRAPRGYWQAWQEEINLSDWVVVNSDWSREALVKLGVSGSKIRTVPLAFESRSEQRPPKAYPAAFHRDRPLRVLFLGQINLRKGIRILFEAAEALWDEPIEYWMVGPTDITIPERYRNTRRFRWTGAVSRSEANRYYEEADVFVLPTLSDGFALTQLEAQARGLPLIASRCCGRVVDPEKNGLLLDPLSGDRLAELLRMVMKEPGKLAAFSRNSQIAASFSLDELKRNLLHLGHERPPPTLLPPERCVNPV